MILGTANRNGSLVKDAIYVQADTSSQIDCYGSYTDRDKTTGLPTNGNHDKISLTSTTATQLIGPAPANNYKVIEFMSFRALIANALTTTVRVQVYDTMNAVSYDVYSAQLAPGETLWYHQAAGWNKSSASGSPPSFNDLVSQFINELRFQFNSLGQADGLPAA